MLADHSLSIPIMARITIEEWLAHHKFRCFPFDQVEAESEDFLLACFIPPSNFRQILDGQTLLLQHLYSGKKDPARRQYA